MSIIRFIAEAVVLTGFMVSIYFITILLHAMSNTL